MKLHCLCYFENQFLGNSNVEESSKKFSNIQLYNSRIIKIITVKLKSIFQHFILLMSHLKYLQNIS